MLEYFTISLLSNNKQFHILSHLGMQNHSRSHTMVSRYQEDVNLNVSQSDVLEKNI